MTNRDIQQIHSELERMGAIQLYYVDDYSIDQIASKIETSKSVVIDWMESKGFRVRRSRTVKYPKSSVQ